MASQLAPRAVPCDLLSGDAIDGGPRLPIDTPERAARLFRSLADLPDERLCCAYLGPDRTLLGLRMVAGGPESVALPLRLIIGDALALGAAALILAHNHPSGNCAPSAADIDATRTLARALRLVDVRLVDHLVLGGPHMTSLRDIGLV